MTGHMPQASVATILAATTAEGQCASEALLQTWHRLKQAVLHSIWAASQVAQHASATQSHPPASPAPSQTPAQVTSRPALGSCLLWGSPVDVGLVRPTHQAAMQNAPPQDPVLSVKVP